MPVCYLIKSPRIQIGTASFALSVMIEGESGDHLCGVLQSAFPGTRAVSKKWAGAALMPRPEEITISGTIPSTAELRAFLQLLEKTVTIVDQLDESHALSPHQVPPNAEYDNWRRTRLGELLNRAK